jgi:hypothetical protein
MGPFPLDDVFGMKAALRVLERSLDQGWYSNYVQWATFRKARSAITNIPGRGVGAGGRGRSLREKPLLDFKSAYSHSLVPQVYGRDPQKSRGNQTYEMKRLVLMFCTRLIKYWKQIGAGQRKKGRGGGSLKWASGSQGGFCTGLRGEEMVRIEFAGTANSVEKWIKKAQDPYFMFVVLGRSKGNQLSGSNFSVPCVGMTQGTNLRPGRWIERLVKRMKEDGVRSGRLLQRRLNPPRIFELEDDYMMLLEQVQATTELIDKEREDIRDRYGIGRTTRRGATAHARNMEVDEDLIKAVNRWMKDDRGAARLDMIELYSESEALTPTYLRYSRAF